jgi:hypothetical protein
VDDPILAQFPTPINPSDSHPTIELVSLRCVDQWPVRAVATVRYGELLIVDVRIVVNGGRLRVQMPGRWRDGEWMPATIATPALLAAVGDCVIEAWKVISAGAVIAPRRGVA